MNLEKITTNFQMDVELLPKYNKIMNCFTEWNSYWKYIAKNLTYLQYRNYLIYYNDETDIK